MNLRKATKAVLLFVILPIFVTVVGGYIVESIKGTPLGEIAAALWHPFGAIIGGASAWLHEPVQLTHISVLVFLAILAWLAWAQFYIRSRLRRVESKIFYTSLGDLVDHITKLQDLRRRAAGGATKDASANGAVAAEFKPDRTQTLAAHVLIDFYPRKLLLPDLAAAMQRVAGFGSPGMRAVAPQGEIARQMEAMEQQGVATIDNPNTVGARYGLTRHGRDFMLENRRSPKPPPDQAAL